MVFYSFLWGLLALPSILLAANTRVEAFYYEVKSEEGYYPVIIKFSAFNFPNQVLEFEVIGLELKDAEASECKSYILVHIPFNDFECRFSPDFTILIIVTEQNTSEENEIEFVINRVWYGSQRPLNPIDIKISSPDANGNMVSIYENTGIAFNQYNGDTSRFSFSVVPSELVACAENKVEFNIGDENSGEIVKEHSTIELFTDLSLDDEFQFIHPVIQHRLLQQVCLDIAGSEKIIAGLATSDYASGGKCESFSRGIVVPWETAKKFELLVLTLRIYPSDVAGFYEMQVILRIAIDNLFFFEGFSLEESYPICETFTYGIRVASICNIPDVIYTVAAPSNIFLNSPSQTYTAYGPQSFVEVPFTLANPCSVIPADVLSNSPFDITIEFATSRNPTGMSSKIITLQGAITEDIYVPGELSEVKLKVEIGNFGSEFIYTFKLSNEHSIPADGSLKFVLDLDPTQVTRYRIFLDNVQVYPAIYDSALLQIDVLNEIQAGRTIEIRIESIVDTNDIYIDKNFRIYSCDTNGYTIDQSADGSIEDESQRESAELEHSELPVRNLEEYVITFALTSELISSADEGTYLGIKTPQQFACENCLGLDDNGDVESLNQNIDFWLDGERIKSEAGDSLEFKCTCTASSITKFAGEFEFMFFDSTGKELLYNKLKAQTTLGSFLKPDSTLECDKTCPKCLATCTLTLRRKSSTGILSVFISSEHLDLSDPLCQHKGPNSSPSGECTVASTQPKSVKLALKNAVLESDVAVIGLSFVYPEYDNSDHHVSILTYTTIKEDQDTLVDQDDSITFSGRCIYPCADCTSPAFCTKCADYLGGDPVYYLYPENPLLCSSATNCIPLAADSCCDGYYKDQTNFKCLACDSATCATCEDSSTICTSCADASKFLLDGACIAKCPQGTFADLASMKCPSCGTGCAECESADKCENCFDGYYLYGEVCVSVCPPETTGSLNSPKTCVDCEEGCEQCTWDILDDSRPAICALCLFGYKKLNARCYETCPEGYVSSSDDLHCVVLSPDASKSQNLLFPHLVAAVLFGASIAIGQARNARVLVVSSLIVVFNYTALSSCIAMAVAALLNSENATAIVSLAVVAVQLILNIAFLAAYKKAIAKDLEFALWSSQHSRLNSFTLALSTILSFQTSRFYYSRFMGFDTLFIRFKDFNSLFKPLNVTSMVQVVFVHCTIVVWDVVQLIRLSWGTMLYVFILESLILSLLLIAFTCYEFKSTGAIIKYIEENIKRATPNGNSTTTVAINTKPFFDEKRLRNASIISRVNVLIRKAALSRNTSLKEAKGRSGSFSAADNHRQKDKRSTESYPCSPKTIQEKSVPSAKPKAAAAKKVKTGSRRMGPRLPSAGNIADLTEEAPLFRRIEAFRKRMKCVEKQEPALFSDTSVLLEMPPKGFSKNNLGDEFTSVLAGHRGKMERDETIARDSTRRGLVTFDEVSKSFIAASTIEETKTKPLAIAREPLSPTQANLDDYAGNFGRQGPNKKMSSLIGRTLDVDSQSSSSKQSQEFGRQIGKE